jgi:hypothetical protein
MFMGRNNKNGAVVCTCAGGDADEAGDHALHGADDGGLLEENGIEACPDEEAAQMLVLSTAREESMLAEYGSVGINHVMGLIGCVCARRV